MTALGPFKRQPRVKQLEALERSAEREYYALFMEQRTGKSQVVLETAAHNYRLGRINALIIFAPNGVHRNWITDEAPEVIPDDVNWRGVFWQSGKMQQVAKRAELIDLLKHPGLALLAVNVDAVLSDYTKKVLRTFLARRPCLAIVDESLDIASPGAKRTKTILSLGKHARMRRILDGTPVDRSPLGLYSQTNFLEHGLLGFKNYATFKAHYAQFEITETRAGQTYPRLIGYQNLEEMKERLASFSFRVTRQECVDLPPKVFQKRYFSLTDAQRRLYRQLRDDYVAEIEKLGRVEVKLVLTRYLRLQQLTSNVMVYDTEPLPCPACLGEEPAVDACDRCEGIGIVPGTSETYRLPGPNPRLEALLDVVSRVDGQGIVWARFRSDFDDIRAALNEHRVPAVFYYGDVSPEDRAEALADFKENRARVFVANPQAAGRGLNLSSANWVVYYSHNWSLAKRRQSEDRPITLSRTDAVLYVDLIAEGTVDEKIIKSLREGKQLSDLITGDKPEDWI